MQDSSFQDKRLTVAGIVSLAVLIVVAAITAAAIADRLDAAVFDPAFCSPTSLHTTPEPPETQLTRDYVAIRILLKDPVDHFEQIRRLYTGDLHVSPMARAQPTVLKRAERTRLFKAEYQRVPWSGSLQQEAHRIDHERGTNVALAIGRGIEAGDRSIVEVGFRELFAALLDELLRSVEQRLDRSGFAGRTLQHARRFYGEALEAYLSINAPEEAAQAGLALEAMSRAIGELNAGNAAARDWFGRERRKFLRVIDQGLGRRVG
jgi:hypothetical protein